MLKKILDISNFLSLIPLIPFLSLERSLIYLIAVAFSSFFSLKIFFISLISFSSSGLGFSLIKCYENNQYFLKNKSLLNFLKAFKNIILKIIPVIFNQHSNVMNYVNHNKVKF